MGRRKHDSAEVRKEAKKTIYMAKLVNNPTSPRKTRLVADLIRGLDVDKAITLGYIHDIGKNLVKLMLESKGFEVIDAGVDVSAEQFVEKAIENDANIISCSALLTTTMLEMRRVVEVATEKGIRDRVKIMIGGAPVTQKYCAEIGADGYTSDAVSAAEMALELVK